MDKRKRIIKGTCVDYTHDGQGVIKTGEEIIFVPSLLKGEEAEIEIIYKGKDFSTGKIKRINKLSEDRIEPLCKIATSCGGCVFQNLKYEKELEFKKSKVENALRRIGGFEPIVDDVIPMERPLYYRNKIQVPLGIDRKGNIISGFYRARTHEIIPTDVCYIESECAAKIITVIKKLMKSMRITSYNEDLRTGTIRHILIRTSLHLSQIMVVLVCNADSFPSRNNFVKALIKECPNITTIIQNINKRASNVILGEQERILYGKGFIEDTILGIKFRISSKSFYQINPIQVEKLYSLVKEYADLRENDTLLDAYSGIGTIGLVLAKNAKEIIGVDIVKDAIKDAQNNALINQITNARYYFDDASSFIKTLITTKQRIDVVVLDPPRKGSDEAFLSSVIALKPRTIIYVSCEPSTLARDLKFLTKVYDIRKITPLDMFPRTSSVETVVKLTLKAPSLFKSHYITSEDKDMLNERKQTQASSINICDIHEDGA